MAADIPISRSTTTASFVRRATPGDLDAISLIAYQVQSLYHQQQPYRFKEATTERIKKSLTKHLENGREISVVMRNHFPVAFVGFGQEHKDVTLTSRARDFCYIDFLCVHQSLRGNGYGKMLLNEVKGSEVACATGFIQHDVGGFNIPAQAFFRSQGFKDHLIRVVGWTDRDSLTDSTGSKSYHLERFDNLPHGTFADLSFKQAQVRRVEAQPKVYSTIAADYSTTNRHLRYAQKLNQFVLIGSDPRDLRTHSCYVMLEAEDRTDPVHGKEMAVYRLSFTKNTCKENKFLAIEQLRKFAKEKRCTRLKMDLLPSEFADYDIVKPGDGVYSIEEINMVLDLA